MWQYLSVGFLTHRRGGDFARGMTSVTVSDLERRTLASQILGSLRHKILNGDIMPGMRFSEESLADAYKVSRSPAREALADLERVGLAVRVGSRDRMITIPTFDMINEKFDVWWIVDVGRTFLAAQMASRADILELRRLVKQMERSADGVDYERYKEASESFHDRIRRGCSNHSMNQLGSEADLYLQWFEMLYDKAPDSSMQTVREHRGILVAFENADLPALSEAIRAHMCRQRDRVLLQFERIRRLESVSS